MRHRNKLELDLNKYRHGLKEFFLYTKGGILPRYIYFWVEKYFGLRNTVGCFIYRGKVAIPPNVQKIPIRLNQPFCLSVHNLKSKKVNFGFPRNEVYKII